jgi:hypothetical protein
MILFTPVILPRANLLTQAQRAETAAGRSFSMVIKHAHF